MQKQVREIYEVFHENRKKQELMHSDEKDMEELKQLENTVKLHSETKKII